MPWAMLPTPFAPENGVFYGGRGILRSFGGRHYFAFPALRNLSDFRQLFADHRNVFPGFDAFLDSTGSTMAPETGTWVST